ncbi:hypothetical protein JEZ13_03690 [bacterium]|nr:hypothetical protein [bacterium]
MLLLSAGSLFSANVSNILDLWNIRTDLGGTYTLTAGINMERTNPINISEYVNTAGSSVGDIVKHEDNSVWFAYYCTTAQAENTAFDTSNWTKMWEVDKGWDPIGDGSNPFHGNFDGDGNIISNLYIDRGASASADNTFPSNGENFVGLFGYVTNGSSISNASNNSDIYIQNVGLTDVNITGKRGTGALIGKVDLPNRNNGKLVITEECYVSSGTVTGFGPTGGLVGANNSQRKQVVPIIRFCYATYVPDIHNDEIYPNLKYFNNIKEIA